MERPDKPRILVVDDDALAAAQIQTILDPIADVAACHDGGVAMQIARTWLPHLVVIDVVLGDPDGFEVRRRLRDDRGTAAIPVLVVTGKHTRDITARAAQLDSDGFLYREDFRKYLLGHVRVLLRRLPAQIYPPASPDATLSIFCLPGGKELVMRLSGDSSRMEAVECRQSINPNDFLDWKTWPASAEWRKMTSYYGELIFKTIFSNPDAVDLYDAAVRAAGATENLRLRIAAPSEFLKVPFEYLYQKNPPGDTFYLILRHPFARSVSGREIKRVPLGRQFFNQIGNRTLRALVIGSNPDDDLSSVAEEIKEVQDNLESGFRNRGIRVDVDVIEPALASYENVNEALNACQYQIVHFAGHGYHNSASPESSGLQLFRKSDRNTKAYLTADRLAELLRDSDVRFLYLSCCESGEAASTEQQGQYDLLGLADGAIRGGVPGVLTFRFKQKDVDLRLLASTFYEKLTQEGDLDRSLFQMRRIWRNPPDDNRWIAPVLFIQR